jgi:hypothetical protein
MGLIFGSFWGVLRFCIRKTFCFVYKDELLTYPPRGLLLGYFTRGGNFFKKVL